MDVRLRKLAEQQDDLVARWQLLALGWTKKMIDHQRSRGWRVVHPGVYALSRAPLTRRQEWIAATLTAPNTVLSHASAGDCFGFRPVHGHVRDRDASRQRRSEALRRRVRAALDHAAGQHDRARRNPDHDGGARADRSRSDLRR